MDAEKEARVSLAWDTVRPGVALCDMTILREDDNSLRHCKVFAGHHLSPHKWMRMHTDGHRDWE